MTVKLNSGTVKVSLPSNYAENRTGAEVTLSYSLGENTTWEQDAEAGRRVSALAWTQAHELQSGGVLSSTAVTVAELPSSALVPEKTVASRNTRNSATPKGPIVPRSDALSPPAAGAVIQQSDPATSALNAVSTTASAETPASGTPAGAPETAALSATASTDAPTTTETPTPPAASLWGSPAGAPTAAPVVQELSVHAEATVSPLNPLTAGTAPVEGPTAPVTAAVVSPSVAGSTATAGGQDGMTNADLTKRVLLEVNRIEQLPGGKGKSNPIMQRICHEIVPPLPGGKVQTVFALTGPQRELFLQRLAAVEGPVP